MKRDRRFMVGLVGVAAIVSYLVWTGVSETMVYYLTPTELMSRVDADPTFREVGIKVSGRVLEGSYARPAPGDMHRFRVRDLEATGVSFPVVYDGVVPDTFTEDVEVVVEGRLRSDGVFEAHTVLTKCGSRYEAAPEEFAG